ncbi:CHAT domain-containing protein [Microbacterium sp. KR10-403]|uniref:CHAT domain-containing protein n=1 Tax=Microbacterium sp. KR10-403 TaxID=3158581 RepID=UPI0032E44DA5
MTPTAAVLHRRAVEQCNDGRFALAGRTLQRAAARTDDIDLQARIKGTQAVVLQRTGQPAEAEALCRQALSTSGLAESTRAVLLGQLGLLALGAGRLHDAERDLSAAIARLSDDPVAEARTRMNRSVTRLQRRDAAGAAADLERAAEIFADMGLTVDEGQAQHNRAYVALLQGDLVAALRGMQEARPRAVTSAVAGAVCDMDQAEVMRDAGLTREAERALTAAAAVFGAQRMPQSRGEAEFQLASSQLLHDPRAAARTAAAAERRFTALGNTAWATRATAVRMRAGLSGGSVQRGGGRLSDPRRVPAAEDVESTASLLDQVGFPAEAAALRLTLAVWQARHRRADGVGTIRVPRRAPIRVQLLAYEARVARASARRRYAEARRAAAEGLDVLTGWRRSFGSLDLQTSIAMHGSDLVFAGLASAVHTGRADIVFEWSERARQLSQQVVPLRPPHDPELAADLAELRMLRADDPDGVDTPRVARLRERARSRQWTQTAAGVAWERQTLEGFVGALDRNTALISFVYTGDALTALVVTDQEQRVVPLPRAPGGRALLPGLRADLDMVATVRTGPLAEVVRRSLDARLTALSEVLLDPPLRVAGDRRIVITAPGILAGIPWAMLPGVRGRAFTLARSATQWAERRSEPYAAAAAGFGVGPRVARGDEEVRAAADAWASSTVLQGDAASVDAVTSLAARVDVLHVAAHGRHAVDNALFSGLELSDGTLFGYDIDRIDHVPDVIVLSACEGGRSSVRWGEEAVGMARIWLSAGARCVIATPVVVADDDACELLGTLHGELAAGRAPAEALAAASTRTGLVTPFQTHGTGF